ncbi:MAG: DNA mismatch repair endonuclease MutL [Firmicutes bacterium]|nr:DNA mismatch repair endonuclease MutL [Bacillota bacterium]
MAIRLLDDHLINKIAAGEVVERPASIVKELVENSIDAGSKRIEVSISGGGIERIEVVDNGAGIAADDVSLALQRHATSKIGSEADLFNITTMGFRGEALPSIAAVSRLELSTQSGRQNGVRAVLEGGRQLTVEPHPTAPGTHMIVRDIFFNTPARKKFLKTAVSEGIHVHEVVSRLALSRPDISISFANEKKQYFKTPGNGILLDAVTAIYGHDYASNFLALQWQGESYALEGLVSTPDFRRVNRKSQTFFVNQRLVKSPMLARAVDEAYRGRLLSREYPAVILYLTIPPEEVDVNVHPQKTEVRFRDEKAVFRLISRAIQARLDHNSPASTIILETGRPWPSGVSQVYPVSAPRANDARLPFAEMVCDPGPGEPRVLDHLDLPEVQHEFAVIGQCFAAYILVEKDNSLWLIDQHAAHERINYNRLVAGHASRASSSQLLVFPVTFELSTTGMDLMAAHWQTFHDLGFGIEALGPNSAIVRSAPTLLQGREIEVISECLQLLEDERSPDIKHDLFALMACKQSVKAGQSLTRQEMAVLVHDLLAGADPMHCPHGRPTILDFNRLEIDKRFKRK